MSDMDIKTAVEKNNELRDELLRAVNKTTEWVTQRRDIYVQQYIPTLKQTIEFKRQEGGSEDRWREQLELQELQDSIAHLQQQAAAAPSSAATGSANAGAATGEKETPRQKRARLARDWEARSAEKRANPQVDQKVIEAARNPARVPSYTPAGLPKYSDEHNEADRNLRQWLKPEGFVKFRNLLHELCDQILDFDAQGPQTHMETAVEALVAHYPRSGLGKDGWWVRRMIEARLQALREAAASKKHKPGPDDQDALVPSDEEEE